ncbi:hypothetical protein TKK_0001923 [Trichogramma kaykai]|uniref:Tyr recombinase domain-containing protein n=1 Tax=Trichogramma kaykai TaxID=54128 RepID=A0ABD2W6Z9_9HYME
MSSDESSEEYVSEEIRESARNIVFNLLPPKSKQTYTAAYNKFKQWRRQKKTNSFCEDVFLAYFEHLSISYSPASLWSIYSMLKSTLLTFNQVDIGSYKQLTALLKRKSAGYQSKKSLTFTRDQIQTFLNEAPDEIYLCTKVALIFGISGALRRAEFVQLKTEDVILEENYMLVKILKTKNHVPRSFTVSGEFYDLCKKYINARPNPCHTDRFFLQYHVGKMIRQPIGINKFGSMPKEVATYLKLPNSDKYTGHSFRRTSATLLVDAGADITVLKRHGGWKSNTVAEGYISESLNNKKKIQNQISEGIQISTKSTHSEEATETAIVQVEGVEQNPKALTSSNNFQHFTVYESKSSSEQDHHQRMIPTTFNTMYLQDDFILDSPSTSSAAYSKRARVSSEYKPIPLVPAQNSFIESPSTSAGYSKRARVSSEYKPIPLVPAQDSFIESPSTSAAYSKQAKVSSTYQPIPLIPAQTVQRCQQNKSNIIQSLKRPPSKTK